MLAQCPDAGGLPGLAAIDGLQPAERTATGEGLFTALQSIAVLSANDMAVAVGERIGGSEDRFAQLMTLRAHLYTGDLPKVMQ